MDFREQEVSRKLLYEVDKLLERQRSRKPERGLSGDRFESSLHHYISNYSDPLRPPTWIVFCTHHGRLWNRGLGVYPRFP